MHGKQTGNMEEKTTTTRGRIAEDLACRYLNERGLHLVQRNYSCRAGELDLIMHDGNELVFVEVRMRNNIRFGSGAESVGFKKQNRLIAAASHYLQRTASVRPCRFDVISVIGISSKPEIEWIRDAFRP